MSVNSNRLGRFSIGRRRMERSPEALLAMLVRIDGIPISAQENHACYGMDYVIQSPLLRPLLDGESIPKLDVQARRYRDGFEVWWLEQDGKAVGEGDPGE